MIKVNGHIVKPTIFPDGTSQVWHIPKRNISGRINDVEWWFESESEIMHLAQLAMLLTRHDPCNRLFMPYFPYARQDKEITNDTSFALYPFLNILRDMGWYTIQSVDVHFDFPPEIMPCKNIRPTWIYDKSSDYDTIIFPDKGAANRYKWINHTNIVIGKKVRDQATGNITHYEITGNPIGSALVIDDLCDGGATFKILAKTLARRVEAIDLYVTHGIFSKGVDVLLEDYDHIYTTNSFFGHRFCSDTLKVDFGKIYKSKLIHEMCIAYGNKRLIVEPLYPQGA